MQFLLQVYADIIKMGYKCFDHALKMCLWYYCFSLFRILYLGMCFNTFSVQIFGTMRVQLLLQFKADLFETLQEFFICFFIWFEGMLFLYEGRAKSSVTNRLPWFWFKHILFQLYQLACI